MTKTETFTITLDIDYARPMHLPGSINRNDSFARIRKNNNKK